MTDPRDGEVYRIIDLEGEIWMAENLRYAAYGSMLNTKNSNLSYGRLYPVQSLPYACPIGWHLPTDDEWDA